MLLKCLAVIIIVALADKYLALAMILGRVTSWWEAKQTSLKTLGRQQGVIKGQQTSPDKVMKASDPFRTLIRDIRFLLTMLRGIMVVATIVAIYKIANQLFRKFKNLLSGFKR